MKTLPLRLALTLVGVLGTFPSAIAASFSGQLSNVTLQVAIDQLLLFNLENVGGAASPTPQITTTGTGTAQGNPTSSTLWVLDPSFSFIQLDYNGGNISGQSGSDGFASAIVSGNSNKLAITNTSGGGQLFTIGGTYLVNLVTAIRDPAIESAQARFTLDIVTESGTTLESFSKSISGSDSFSETKDFTVSFNVGAGETVFLKSELSGSAEAELLMMEIPEPSTRLGYLLVLGLGVLTTKRKKTPKLADRERETT